MCHPFHERILFFSVCVTFNADSLPFHFIWKKKKRKKMSHILWEEWNSSSEEKKRNFMGVIVWKIEKAAESKKWIWQSHRKNFPLKNQNVYLLCNCIYAEYLMKHCAPLCFSRLVFVWYFVFIKNTFSFIL